MNKNITDISYNWNNLPKHILLAQGNQNTIDYLYDAAVTKLRKVTSSDQAAGITTDYTGPFVYEDSKLAFIQTSEGRVVPDHDAYAYEYFLRVEAKRKSRNLGNHLGNTRVVFNEQGDVLQDNSYYPFGGMMEGLNYTAGLAPENKYLYNGKEFEDDFGLDWYDYGARFYASDIARFTTQDPLAEDYYSLSPYVYCAGNPIASRDENGEWINFVVGAVVGAATDYAVQVVTNVVENGGELTMDAFTNVDGGSIALSAGTGAMGVGIASGVSKLTKVAKVAQVAAKSKTAAKAVQNTANIVGDVTSSVAGTVVQGNEVTVEGVAADVLGGAVGRKVSTNVTNKAQSKQRVLNNQVDRAQRVAKGSSRQSRINNAASTQQKAKNHQNMTKARAATAGGVSSNSTSKTAGAVVNTQKDDENR